MSSVTSPTSQLILILQAFCHFTYITSHSPTLPSLYLRHNSFSNPYFASLTSQDFHLCHLVSRPWPFSTLQQQTAPGVAAPCSRCLQPGICSHRSRLQQQQELATSCKLLLLQAQEKFYFPLNFLWLFMKSFSKFYIRAKKFFKLRNHFKCKHSYFTALIILNGKNIAVTLCCFYCLQLLKTNIYIQNLCIYLSPHL